MPWKKNEMGCVSFGNTLPTAKIKFLNEERNAAVEHDIKSYDSNKYKCWSSHSSCIAHGVELYENISIKFIYDDLEKYWNEDHEITDVKMQNKWYKADLEARIRYFICLLEHPILMSSLWKFGVEQVVDIDISGNLKGEFNVHVDYKHVEFIRHYYCKKHGIDRVFVAKLMVDEKKFDLEKQRREATVDAFKWFYYCNLYHKWHSVKMGLLKWLKKNVRKQKFKRRRSRNDISIEVQKEVIKVLKKFLKLK